MNQPSSPPARVEPLGFGDVLRLGWAIIQLDEHAMDTARGPSVTLTLALAVAAIGGALSSVTSGPLFMVVGAVYGVLGLAISVGIAHVLANAFGGKGDFEALFKVLAVGSLVKWAGVVPFVGLLAHLWFVVMMVAALRRVHQVSTGTAVLVVLIPALLILAGSFLLTLGMLLGGLALMG